MLITDAPVVGGTEHKGKKHAFPDSAPVLIASSWTDSMRMEISSLDTHISFAY